MHSYEDAALCRLPIVESYHEQIFQPPPSPLQVCRLYTGRNDFAVYSEETGVTRQPQLKQTEIKRRGVLVAAAANDNHQDVKTIPAQTHQFLQISIFRCERRFVGAGGCNFMQTRCCRLGLSR